uniref:Putative DNA polymerase n=1 Tax=viral metagenome TaxID=1070528 RepID=A0A6H1ZUF9_9ZZZZ
MLVNTEGPTDAAIMFVGEAPGETEDKTGRPFTGFAGTTLNTLLSQAGIARYQCLVTNVAREQPPANKISYFFEDKKCTIPKPKLVYWINQLKEEIKLYKPKVVIALGATALWALTGQRKISEYRGYILPCSLVPGVKVLPTYHPQAVNHEWKLFVPTVLDLRKALRHSTFLEIPESQQILVPNADVRRFVAYMEECIAHPEWEYLSVDVETIQPGSHIEELGLSHNPNFGMSIFLLKGRAPALPEKDELLLWQTFTRLIACKKIVMQNAAYDIGVIWYNQHIFVETLWMDTLIAAHVCWPELPRDLGFLGSICLDIAPWKSKAARTAEYNTSDAANALGIAFILDKELTKEKIRHTFDFEMSLIPVALMMQLQGIAVDKDKQQELIKLWTEKRAEFKIQLDTVLGKEINFNSPKQMQQLLYLDLKLPVQYKRRKSVNEPRTMTIDANALRTLSRLVPDNPIFNLILEYKKADSLLKFIDVELSPKGRVHTSYNITGASSDDEEDTKKTKRSFGRWSSSGSIILPYGSGNLQNIPLEVRKMYRAKPGWKIIEADYSQAEAVIVAHLTGNQKMIKMFKDSFGLSPTEKSPYDIHVLKASELFGIPIDQVTPEQRRVGKTIRHARNYKAGPTVLANALRTSLSNAKDLIALDERIDPSLGMWHVATQEALKTTRTLTNLLGRQHRFLDRWCDAMFRSAYSYKPQSTVGDLLNIALKRLYDSLLEIPWEIEIMLQLHDALYVMVEETNVMPTIRHIRECMLIPLKYNYEEFIIDAEFKVKDSWAEGETLELNWRN